MIARTETGQAAVRCAIYTRVSTFDQAQGDFSSIDNQRETARKLIDTRAEMGWQPTANSYDDSGFSGGTMERPALQRLLGDIEAGLIEHVVVYKLDRLSRTLRDLLQILDHLKERKVGFVSVSESFDTSGAMGQAMLGMIGVFAELERGMISERTRDKMIAARKRGHWTGGPPPLGYDVHPEGGSLVVNETEAVIVRGIFQLYLECETLTATLAGLRERGWRTKTWETRRGNLRQGAPFQKASLRRLLGNPVYIGKIPYGGELYDGKHDAIVEPELWDQVQAKLAANATNGGAGTKNRNGYLLRGLLRCTPCDAAMTPSMTRKGNRSYKYYRCVKAEQNGHATCPTRSIPADEIERVVVERIAVIGKDRHLQRETITAARQQLEKQRSQLTANLKTAGRRLTSLRKERKRLPAVAAKKGPTGQAATQRLEELAGEIEAATAQRAELKAQLETAEHQSLDPEDLRRVLREFEPIWEVLLPRERARALRLLLEQVDYDGSTGTLGMTFRPTGIAALTAEAPTTEEVSR